MELRTICQQISIVMITVLFVAYFMTWGGGGRKRGVRADCDGGGGGVLRVMGW